MLILAKIILNFYQYKYIYCFFILPDRHFIKKSFPISLKIGDKSTQLGKLLKNDKIQSFNQKVRTYSQYFAQ